MESSRARRDRRARPPRRRPLLHGALATVVVCGTAAGTAYVNTAARPGVRAVSSAATSSPSASISAAAGGEASVEPVAEPTVNHDALLADAMKTVHVEDGAAVSVAVLDLDSGASAVYGDGGFDTASIVKVDILAALLLQAQDAGRELTAAERSYAVDMIEYSDNTAASALWRTIGQAQGLDSANGRLGLTDTAGGNDMYWGLTQTTAADQLALLRQVFGAADSELSANSRAYLTELMGRVAADQRWGVSAVADGSAWALKNGWLPRTATGLWDINSIGRVTADGNGYLVAVLSDGNSTKQQGVAMVEAATRAAVSVFTAGGASTAPGAMTPAAS
ncbi:serine hydrolase [Streptomyces chartreusis]